MDRKDLLLTCLKFINHLRQNNCLDDIEIGNTSCRNCLDKISLFYELYEKYFGSGFDICKEMEKIEKPKQELRFSKRELEFAKLLCLPDSEIAKRLIVAPSTAKTHIHNMRIRMCTKTKASTIIELIRAGIIDINEVETE